MLDFVFLEQYLLFRYPMVKIGKVEAILLAMWPDLPTPVTTILPRLCSRISQARENVPSMRFSSAVIDSDSILMVLSADSIKLLMSLLLLGG